MSVRSILVRIKHAIIGKPITYEEQQAARASLEGTYRGDPMQQQQMEIRNARFPREI